MLSMPDLQVHHPQSAQEAVRLASTLPNAHYIAGGTDLVPNLKQGLYDAGHLISLRGVGIDTATREADGGWTLGAGITLAALAAHQELAVDHAALPSAASHVAGPQHRVRGTLGGNVMLDTRCLYYNQTAEWRHALGYCLKREGDWCHVVGSKATCVAAHSSDTVPVLVALGAELVFLTADGEVVVPLAGVFTKDGRPERNRSVPPEALLTHVRVPASAQGLRSAFGKLRQRGSIDFAQLNVGVAARIIDGKVQDLSIVFSGLMPKPKPLRLKDVAVGRALDDALILELEALAYKQVRPQPSRDGDVGYRRRMAPVLLRRALHSL